MTARALYFTRSKDTLRVLKTTNAEMEMLRHQTRARK